MSIRKLAGLIWALNKLSYTNKHGTISPMAVAKLRASSWLSKRSANESGSCNSKSVILLFGETPFLRQSPRNLVTS